MQRRGFTLVELLVSLAVLSIALATVARVFSVTSQAATQAAAYSEAQSWVRQFAFDLKEDLRNIVPSESILVLRGRKIPAALTQDDLDAGLYYRELVGNPNAVSPANNNDPRRRPASSHTAGPGNNEPQEYSDPRADLMMFITNRPQSSNAPLTGNFNGNPTSAAFAMQTGAKVAPVCVTYGHAAIANAVSDGARFVPEPASAWKHIAATNRDNQSIIPAQEWYLARRAILLINDPLANLRTISAGSWYETNLPGSSALLLGLPGQNTGGANNQVVAGDAVVLRLRDDVPFSQAQFGLLDAFDPPANVVIPPQQDPAFVPPYTAFNASPRFRAPDYDNLMRLMYPNPNENTASNFQHIATIIPNPPADLKENLSLQALPGCTWFQVEFLMPEDVRNNPQFRDPSPDDIFTGPNPSDPLRWTSVDSGSTIVFVPDSARNRSQVSITPGSFDGDPVRGYLAFGTLPDPVSPDVRVRNGDDPTFKPIRMWPYGIRVTVRAYDPQGRLDQPLVRTITHRFN